MNIYAFNKPNDKNTIDFIKKSLWDGYSRFAWSYSEKSDLRKLQEKKWNEFDETERECWKKSHFLLNIKKGDWIIHINVPEWGKCIAAKVRDGYSFDDSNKLKDFRHIIPIEKDSIIEFDRNSKNVLPITSRKLKLRGRYWNIKEKDEFLESMGNLIENKIDFEENNISKELYYLREQLSPSFKEINKIIHNTHLGKNLEKLIAKVFENMDNILTVQENGSGYGTDYGADLIVTFRSGLPIENLYKDETLIVQIKSYEGRHSEINAVNQIETGIEKYNADYGLIITTAEKTDELENAIANLSQEIDKPISLIAGEDVAKFILKYSGDLII